MAGTITHYWDGTTLVVTSDSGTTRCDLKGPQGDMGVRGPQGAQGKAYEGLSLYPIGAIYISTIDTSPASTLGGTWERIQDKFLLGANDTNAGTTGGAAEVTLTASQLPAHSHYISTTLDATSVYLKNQSSDIVADTTGSHSAYFSGRSEKIIRPSDMYGRLAAVDNQQTRGGAHNNMPPYLAVYMWKRVA